MKKRMRQSVTCLAGVFFLAMLTGCSTTSKVKSTAPQKRAKLVRTQAGDQVTLQWTSDPSIDYSVIYSKTLDRNQKWQDLAGYSRIQGNGSTIAIRFTAPEPGQLYYRLSERRR